MKKVLLCWWLVYFSIGYSQTPTQTLNPDPHWEHQWTSDFNLTDWRIHPINGSVEQKIDSYWYGDKWKIAHDYLRENEPQTFLINNASLNTEGIILTAKYVSPSYLGRQYTSGLLSSFEGVGLVKYGYLEARIKVSDIYGLWPAFWLWNSDANTTNTHEEEIDIFEMIPGHIVGTEKNNISGSSTEDTNPFVGQTFDKSLMTSNVHKFNPSFDDNPVVQPNPNPKNDPNRYDRGLVTKLPDLVYYTDYIVYAVEWNPSKITYFVNGQIIKEDPNPFIANLDKSIIFNLSLNPWVSEYNHNHPYFGTPYNDNINPAYFDPVNNYPNQTSINNTNAEMVIDYVKFYKLDMSECDTSVSYTTLAGLNSYNSKVKKSINIYGNILLDNDSPKVLRASDSITLDVGFDSNSKEIYIDVNGCY